MSLSDGAAWFAAGTAAFGLLWTVVTQARERATRAQAERAEQAGRLLALMQEIDLAGSEPTLDVERTRSLHAAQLLDLQRIIRLGTADFAARSLKPAISLSTITGVGLYTVAVMTGGIFLLASSGTDEGEPLGNLIAGLAYVLIAAVGLVVTPILALRRSRRVAQLRKAGVTVGTGFVQDLREIRNRILIARHRRRQRDDLTQR